jgi:hypothetical protein
MSKKPNEPEELEIPETDLSDAVRGNYYEGAMAGATSSCLNRMWRRCSAILPS